MIQLEDGLSLCGRCIWGNKVGHIVEVNSRTYRVRWIDGEYTTQLRPDLDDEDTAERGGRKIQRGFLQVALRLDAPSLPR